MKIGRINFGVAQVESMPDPQILSLIQARKASLYREGLADGIETTLSLLLGEKADGGELYDGDLPEEVRDWAETALERVRREKKRG